jgi:bacteriocin biosynthesis cyclodehydratase domain-containing protein
MQHASIISAVPPSAPLVRIVSVGSFGCAVSKYLSRFVCRFEEISADGDLVASTLASPIGHIIVLAAWRPVPALCEKLNCVSYETRTPFIPLIIDGPVLRLGPIVQPGTGGCWTCWTHRVAQHNGMFKDHSALMEFYNGNPSRGPSGFLEPVAMIGAAQVARTVRALVALDEHIPGSIWQMDMFTRHVSHGLLVGVDGCDKCGLNRCLITRSYAAIKEQLTSLWQG